LLINKLNIKNLRNLEQVELSPHPSINTFFGSNGAGKTSVLESLAILSRGRSFRGNKIGGVIGQASSKLSVYAEISGDGDTDEGNHLTRMGLERSSKDWKARRDGNDLNQLSELAESLAVVVMEPNSHLLVSGSPDVRRRYLDWGVFHVEPRYLDSWRRYARALKQRNAALRAGQVDVLAGLDSVLVLAGEQMTELRSKYVEELSGSFSKLMSELSPGLGKVSLEYHKGWSAVTLEAALSAQRNSDIERGSTHSGPHRADLKLKVDGYVVRDTASRGEQKVLATALVLAQTRRHCESDKKPLLLLDDLASEFDQHHFAAALEVGIGFGVQIWITGVEEFDPGTPHSRFHVEHGQVRKMV